MKGLAGKVAAITGAGSGMGRALAESLAPQGCHVAICDVNAAALQATEAALRQHSVNVSSHSVDVRVALGQARG